MDWQAQLVLVGHVLLAASLGGVLGYERERAHKPAGLRTHMLVAAGSCLLMLVGLTLIKEVDEISGSRNLSADPVRIIQAIVVGISFLGAGTIVQHGSDRVRGLTTAASILLAAAIGITVALRLYVVAACITLLVLFIIAGLGWLERRLSGSPPGETQK